MWRAIEDAAIFDEDEDGKDDNSEDDSISKIRRDAGGKTKKSVPCKKTNSSSITELNNENNSDKRVVIHLVESISLLWPIVATIFHLLSPICWALLQPSLDEPAILTITPQSWERSS